MTSRRMSLTLLGLVLAAVTVLGAVVSLGGPVDDHDAVASVLAAEPSPTASPTDGASPSPLPTELDDLGELPVTTYEVFLARDPFEPVVPVTAPTTDPTANPTSPTTGPTTSPTTGPTTSPTTGPTTSPTATPTATPPGGSLPPTGGPDCTQGETVVCNGHTIRAIDVFSDAAGPGAVIQVDDALYEVRPGDQFAVYFVVRAIDPPAVTLQYGEDVFTLFEGESVLK